MVSARFLRPFSSMAAPVKVLMNRFPGLNAAVWNAQYRLGMWNGLDSGSSAQVMALLEKYTAKPSIIDLGCGKGVNLDLTPDNYRSYHGVDISANSIQAAREQARPNATFEAADVLTYETAERYDAILLREVLYYFPKQRITEFLRRIAGILEPDGKIFIQFWDKSACAEYIDIVLNSGFPVLEEHVEGGSGPRGTVLVLQAPGD
jgi:cyclopropane fatty-acyl-phospholipid synthase-like methyltransferase